MNFLKQVHDQKKKKKKTGKKNLLKVFLSHLTF